MKTAGRNSRRVMYLPEILVTGAILMCFTGVSGARTIVVDVDGGGDFRRIQEAIASIPDNNTERTVIRLKPGRHPGPILIPKEKPMVTFEGEDVEKTVITYGLNIYEVEEIQPGDQVRVPLPKRYRGTGVVVLSDDFRAKNVTFESTSGDRGPSIALRIDGDRAVLVNCRMLGWQDTLMLNTGRQYFRNCYIEGRVDFIFGSGTAVFEGCEIHSKNGGHITAASTPENRAYGFVFIDCRLTGDPRSWRNPWVLPAQAPMANLGRPWRPHASVTFINCQMGEHIRPEGWNNWGRVDNEKTVRYAEYGSRRLDEKRADGTVVRGEPVDVSRRVPWSRQLTQEEAARYTLANIFGDWDGAY
ncbi:MAG TPA: pectinesterase family protein [Sedimentisphaerales bacterium]|nr:pectinesterase family protein [Sedimentisphaerales bacterium]